MTGVCGRGHPQGESEGRDQRGTSGNPSMEGAVAEKPPRKSERQEGLVPRAQGSGRSGFSHLWCEKLVW